MLPLAAHISAVWSRKVSMALTLAPRSISVFAISAWLPLMASISAVWLSWFGDSMFGAGIQQRP